MNLSTGSQEKTYTPTWKEEEIDLLFSFVHELNGGLEPNIKRNWKEIAQCMNDSPARNPYRKYTAASCSQKYHQNAARGHDVLVMWSAAEIKALRGYIHVSKYGGENQFWQWNWLKIAEKMRERFPGEKKYNMRSCRVQWEIFIKSEYVEEILAKIPNVEQASESEEDNTESLRSTRSPSGPATINEQQAHLEFEQAVGGYDQAIDGDQAEIDDERAYREFEAAVIDYDQE